MAQQWRLESSSYWKGSADCSFPPSALTHQGGWRRQYQRSQNRVSYNQAPSHLLHPEHIHRQETLEGAPQSKIPSIIPAPCLFKRRPQEKNASWGNSEDQRADSRGQGRIKQSFSTARGKSCDLSGNNLIPEGEILEEDLGLGFWRRRLQIVSGSLARKKLMGKRVTKLIFPNTMPTTQSPTYIAELQPEVHQRLSYSYLRAERKQKKAEESLEKEMRIKCQRE